MVWLDWVKVVGVLYLVWSPLAVSAVWWAVGSPVLMDPDHICKKSRRMGGKQRQICKNEPEIVKEVARGTLLALKECAWQFRDRRWNCSTEKRGTQKVLKLDTRESAFVNSIISAGAMYSVTEACSAGRLLQCGCDRRPPAARAPRDGSWEWGGCHDDVRYAHKKTRAFLEPRRRRTARRIDIGLKLQLHNYQAGRLAIRKNMRRICKCHGLSASCTLKTCWLKMPKFATVAKVLREHFNGASLVTISNDGKALIHAESIYLYTADPQQVINNEIHSDNSSIGLLAGQSVGRLKPIGDEDLVYTTQSPDYCLPDRGAGSLGTKQRACVPGHPGLEGCGLMCCGRGYRTFNIKDKHNCRCKFQWCCEVNCDTCDVISTTHRCK